MNADDEGWPDCEPGWLEREAVSRATAGDREAALDAIDHAVSGLATGTLTHELGNVCTTAVQR